MHRSDEVWKDGGLVRTFLDGVRGGVPYAADQLLMMLRALGARGAPLRNVIDLGCGSGVLARSVVAQWPEARVTLVDFSEPMLTAARALWHDHSPSPSFIAADLAEPGWIDSLAGAPYDAIVSGYAIHHLTHARKRALFAEIFALLEPDGMFVNVEHVASTTAWVAGVSDDLLIDSLHAFDARSGGHRTREQVADEFIHRPDQAANILAPVETQCEWLRQIGFVDVDCFFKVFELAVFGGRKPRS